MRSFQPLSSVVVSLILAVTGAALAAAILVPWLGRLTAGDDPRRDPLASWVAVEMAPEAGAPSHVREVVACLERALSGSTAEVRQAGIGRWRVEVWTRGAPRPQREVVDCVRDGGFHVRTVSFGLNLWTVLLEPASARERMEGFLAGFLMGGLLAFPLMLLAVSWRRMGTAELRDVLRPSPRFLGLGLAAGLGLVGVSVLFSMLLSLLGCPLREQPWFEAVSGLGGSWRTVFAAVLVVLVPLAEELFFRGYAFRFLLARSGRATAYVASSVLFALVHFHPAGAVLYLADAVVLAWLTHRTARVVSSVVAHAVVNAAAVFLMVSGHG